jgi:hypothetical protein
VPVQLPDHQVKALEHLPLEILERFSELVACFLHLAQKNFTHRSARRSDT